MDNFYLADEYVFIEDCQANCPYPSVHYHLYYHQSLVKLRLLLIFNGKENRMVPSCNIKMGILTYEEVSKCWGTGI
jgi:hypothetical protein